MVDRPNPHVTAMRGQPGGNRFRRKPLLPRFVQGKSLPGRVLVDDQHASTGTNDPAHLADGPLGQEGMFQRFHGERAVELAVARRNAQQAAAASLDAYGNLVEQSGRRIDSDKSDGWELRSQLA